MPVAFWASRVLSLCRSSTPMILAARMARACSRSAFRSSKSRNTLPLPRTSFDFFLHRNASFSRLRRSLMRPTSECGVLIPVLRFLLKRMNDPEIDTDLHRVNGAKRIAPVTQRDFEHAATDAFEGLRRCPILPPSAATVSARSISSRHFWRKRFEIPERALSQEIGRVSRIADDKFVNRCQSVRHERHTTCLKRDLSVRRLSP